MNIGIRIQILHERELFIPSFPINSTIANLKSRIAMAKKLPFEQIQLSLHKTSIILADDINIKSIKDIKNNQILSLDLNLHIKNISVRVRTPNNYIFLTLPPLYTVFKLKEYLQGKAMISASNQILTYNGIVLEDNKLVSDYVTKNNDDAAYMSEESNITSTSRSHDIILSMRKIDKQKFSLGINLSFNSIKLVNKTSWKQSAPWYREVTDGASWICYCYNPDCSIFNQMFIVKKGYGHFHLHIEMVQIKCPICMELQTEIRNIGFVNSQWQYKGKLSNKKDSKISGDGRTYDDKFHTFKETKYKEIWSSLEFLVKHLDPKVSMTNIEEIDEENNKEVMKNTCTIL